MTNHTPTPLIGYWQVKPDNTTMSRSAYWSILNSRGKARFIYSEFRIFCRAVLAKVKKA